MSHLTLSPSRLRQRSIQYDPISPTDSLFSNTDTVVDLSADDDQGRRKSMFSVGGSFSAGSDEGKSGLGYLSWNERQKRLNEVRRKWVVRGVLVGLMGLVGSGGYFLGRSTSPSLPPLPTSTPEPPCNPYSLPGVLLVNTSVPSLNQWEPIALPSPECKPIDWLSKMKEGNVRDMEWARNRTVVLYGDSVDRGHNHDFCTFSGGRIEMIGSDHRLSPAYPSGTEFPPEGYENKDGERKWPNFDQSRPFVCTVDNLGLRVVNVFHYGFLDEDRWLSTHGHFYPPALFSSRFHSIVLPLLSSLGSPTPDLLSLTSGYWGLLRHSLAQDDQKDEAIRNGMDGEEAERIFDTWRNMGADKRGWLERRIKESVEMVLDTWRGERSPRIMWRTLHHIGEQIHMVPYDRIQSLDQIGISVIQRLQASSSSIASKLKIDNWGHLILGQDRHFIDALHPRDLPCNFLYGNMMMQNLKEAVEENQ